MFVDKGMGASSGVLARALLLLSTALFTQSSTALEPVDLETLELDMEVGPGDYGYEHVRKTYAPRETYFLGGKAESRGLMRSCTQAAGMPPFVPPTADAVEQCKDAAKAGFAAADIQLAEWYWKGELVSQDQGKALALLQRAYAKRYSSAAYLLGAAYSDRTSSFYDEKMARHWLEKSVLEHSPEGYVFLARFHLYTSTKATRFQDAYKLLNDCAEKLQSPYCDWGKAEHLFHGLGVTPDPERAMAYFNQIYRKLPDHTANCLAWRLATSPWPEHRDGEQAVMIMQRLAEKRRLSAAEIDTLAAAFAAKGDFLRAVIVQREAIEEAKKDSRFTPTTMIGMNRRLTAYEKGEGWTEHLTPEWIASTTMERLDGAVFSLASTGK